MLGPPKPRRLDEPVAASLEALVPPDHFYRHLEAKLDLGFVREWVRELYAERGRPSIDPIVFFKLQLVMFFEGIRSERKLVETASLHLAHRWYLGYALDEPLPDHSSLTRIRQRLGIGIFERFFEKVIDLCQEAGLVWGKELYFDATKVVANADVDSLVPRFYREAKAHVAGLFAGEPTPADGQEAHDADPPPRGVGPVPPEGPLRLPAREAPPEALATQEPEPGWKLLEERRLDPRRPSVEGYRRTTDFLVSATDPDATPMRTGGGTSLGYRDHYVVDGGKARVILAVLVTPADVTDNVPMRDLLWRVRFRRKLRPHHVTGDAKYGTAENVAAVEDAGIRAYVPLSDAGHRPGLFRDTDFVYDAAADAYRCPQGEVLRFLSQCEATRRRIYQAPATACVTCAVRAECTTSSRGRRVSRSLDEACLERVRGYHQTEAYAKAMRKRQVWVEPLFAEAKAWHGLRRFRLRGLGNVNMEALLVAAGQNVKRLLSRWGWGRRPWPNGAAGVLLPASAPVPAALA